MSGGGGFMSNMQTSLKMNNRRKGRERLKKSDPATPQKMRYNVNEVSELEREKIVRRILKRRKITDRIAFTAVFLAAFALAVFLLI